MILCAATSGWCSYLVSQSDCDLYIYIINYSFKPSPAAFYTTARGQMFIVFLEIPSPKVEKKTLWLHVFPTESVKLGCQMNGSSDWTFTWYKDGQVVHAGESVSLERDASVLFIKSTSASHRGKYSCSGKHKQRSVSSNITSGLQLDVYGEANSIPYRFT